MNDSNTEKISSKNFDQKVINFENLKDFEKSQNSERSPTDSSSSSSKEDNLNSMKDFILKISTQNFNETLRKKIRDTDVDSYSNFFNETDKVVKSFIYINTCKEGGMVFVDDLENIGRTCKKYFTSKEFFEQRLKKGLDFEESDDPFLEDYVTCKRHLGKNRFAENLIGYDENNLYSIDLTRRTDVILDILVPKDLEFIEIRDTFGNLLAFSSKYNYEEIDENEVNDPYILNEYRKAPLFESVLPMYALSLIKIMIVIPNQNSRILARTSILSGNNRRFLSDNFKGFVKFRCLPINKFGSSENSPIKEEKINYYDIKKSDFYVSHNI